VLLFPVFELPVLLFPVFEFPVFALSFAGVAFAGAVFAGAVFAGLFALTLPLFAGVVLSPQAIPRAPSAKSDESAITFFITFPCLLVPYRDLILIF
jgi:hypothetical protein